MPGKILSIHTAAEAGAPMRSVPEIMLEPGLGVVGDRYYFGVGTFSEKNKGKPDSDLTLIESEEIDAFNREESLSLDHGTFRRNVITEGIHLNDFVGKTFRLGATMAEGIRLCEPCAHLAGLLTPKLLPAMVHRAGLRARIVTGGVIRVNDEIDLPE